MAGSLAPISVSTRTSLRDLRSIDRRSASVGKDIQTQIPETDIKTAQQEGEKKGVVLGGTCEKLMFESNYHRQFGLKYSRRYSMIKFCCEGKVERFRSEGW